MDMKNNQLNNAYVKMVILAFLVGMIMSCTYNVKSVSNYDQQIDKSITSLQKRTEKVLLMIESYEGQPESQYDFHKSFYQEAKIDISSLRIRAEAIQSNSLTVQMLDQLLNNINRFEKDHKKGISPKEVSLYRGGFNSQFTAILTFELAKKR